MIKTLLHISGGLDSTYVLYDWLRNNPNEKILIHRINLRHCQENRLPEESNAVTNILAWLRANGMSNFEYHLSHFDYGTLPRMSMIKDIQIVALYSGMILTNHQWKDIDTLLLSWHKGEVDALSIRRGYRVRAMLKALNITRPITFEFPIEFKSRRDMKEDMPASLYDLVSSCRRPQAGRPCNKCWTCREYDLDGLDPK